MTLAPFAQQTVDAYSSCALLVLDGACSFLSPPAGSDSISIINVDTGVDLGTFIATFTIADNFVVNAPDGQSPPLVATVAFNSILSLVLPATEFPVDNIASVQVS